MNSPIPQELLDAVVYDPSSPTGLWWREGGRGRRPDLQCGSIQHRAEGPRCQVGFNKRMYYNYRVIWALHHGDPGPLVVDHIDRDPLNNRIENLQAITLHENNKRIVGKGYYKYKGRWRSYIRVDGTRQYLGFFDTEEEARAAYVAAKEETVKGLEVNLEG